LLTINAGKTGTQVWNAGPCTISGQTELCGGNANILFVENADGTITGTIQSVSYSSNNGPAPSSYQPAASDPHAGDSFMLQHSGTHLLYTTWLGKRSDLNSNNRYWCDAYALQAGYQQCGA
jgi:hypothetical protein